MQGVDAQPASVESLPSRERGLKFLVFKPRFGISASLPSRERGLKLGGGQRDFGQGLVAPFTGAWIEMAPVDTGPPRRRWSLPSRERGLKSLGVDAGRDGVRSLPSRERGLKYVGSIGQ